VRFIVTTTAGSKYIDQKLELDVSSKSSVKELKGLIQVREDRDLLRARTPIRSPTDLRVPDGLSDAPAAGEVPWAPASAAAAAVLRQPRA
jgi:hypothetical protein